MPWLVPLQVRVVHSWPILVAMITVWSAQAIMPEELRKHKPLSLSSAPLHFLFGMVGP